MERELKREKGKKRRSKGRRWWRVFGTGAGYTKDASGLRPAPTVLGVGKKKERW